MTTRQHADSVFVQVASAAIASVVATIPGKEGKAINITTLDCTGDAATQALQVWIKQSITRSSMAMASGQSVCYVGVTAGFNAYDPVVVRHQSGNYQKTTVLSVGASSITLGANLTNAFAYDVDRPDEIVGLTKAYAIILGSSGIQKFGDKQLWIPRGSPAYFSVANGTTAAINAIVGVYV